MTLFCLLSLVLVFFIGQMDSFLVHPNSLCARSSTKPQSLFSNKAETEERLNDSCNDDGDDDDDIQPYQERTLAWTKRYRRLVPYESARLTAMRLGLRSKEEWDDIRQFGKAFHGAHSVSRPDLMYAKEWISWDEFLGVMRPYEEAKEMVRNLELKSMEDYIAFVKADVKRAESLRIPAKPEIVYRNKGWEGEDAFFSVSDS